MRDDVSVIVESDFGKLGLFRIGIFSRLFLRVAGNIGRRAPRAIARGFGQDGAGGRRTGVAGIRSGRKQRRDAGALRDPAIAHEHNA